MRSLPSLSRQRATKRDGRRADTSLSMGTDLPKRTCKLACKNRFLNAHLALAGRLARDGDDGIVCIANGADLALSTQLRPPGRVAPSSCSDDVAKLRGMLRLLYRRDDRDVWACPALDPLEASR